MKLFFRAMTAALLIGWALAACGCGGGSGSGGAGAVDSQLRDDSNWHVIQTADQ